MKSLALLLFSFLPLLAHEGHSHNPASAEMTVAAKTFLGSLDDSQKKAAQFSFQTDERENWHFVPMTRQGLRLDAMKPHQQQLAFGLLATGLTQRGFMTAVQVMTLEQILADRGEDPEHRNPQKYFVAIFGNPSEDKPWGWRFEGHHLSLNFTLSGDHALGVPMFFGTNPAELKTGPLKGLRPLGEIEDLARNFAQELYDAKLSPVFSDQAPKEILTSQDRTAKAQKIEGITSDQLDGEQIKKLYGIIDSVAELKRPEVYKEALQKIHSSQRKKINFAWGGSLEKGKAHYFRLQGTDFLIEYANTQNNANHAHLVWRDLKNDFGRDVLKAHYEQKH